MIMGILIFFELFKCIMAISKPFTYETLIFVLGFQQFLCSFFGTYGKIQQFHHHHKCAKEKVMTTLSSGCQIASELQFVCHKGVILIAKYIQLPQGRRNVYGHTDWSAQSFGKIILKTQPGMIESVQTQ